MSGLIPLSVDTIAVGLVSSVVVYPIYLVILFLFRMSRSKVGGASDSGEQSLVPVQRAVLSIMAAKEGQSARPLAEKRRNTAVEMMNERGNVTTHSTEINRTGNSEETSS